MFAVIQSQTVNRILSSVFYTLLRLRPAQLACRAALYGLLAAFAFAPMRTVQAAPAIAMHGAPALPEDFIAAPYVNPDASKGGTLVQGAKSTDCRAMCVGPDGTVWTAVTEHGVPEGPTLHLVGYRPGTKSTRDHGPVGVANPNFTTFTDAAGKPKPWHHTMRKAKDGTLTPWVPMGVCAAADGSVYITTIAPFTLLKFVKEQLK